MSTIHNILQSKKMHKIGINDIRISNNKNRLYSMREGIEFLGEMFISKYILSLIFKEN